MPQVIIFHPNCSFSYRELSSREEIIMMVDPKGLSHYLTTGFQVGGYVYTFAGDIAEGTPESDRYNLIGTEAWEGSVVEGAIAVGDFIVCKYRDGVLARHHLRRFS